MNTKQYREIGLLSDMMGHTEKALVTVLRRAVDTLQHASQELERDVNRVERGDHEWAESGLDQAVQRVGSLPISTACKYRAEYAAFKAKYDARVEQLDALSPEEQAALEETVVREDKAARDEAAVRSAEAAAKDKARCHGTAIGEPSGMVRGWRSKGTRCSRKGSIEVNGTMYCKQHAAGLPQPRKAQ